MSDDRPWSKGHFPRRLAKRSLPATGQWKAAGAGDTFILRTGGPYIPLDKDQVFTVDHRPTLLQRILIRAGWMKPLPPRMYRVIGLASSDPDEP